MLRVPFLFDAWYQIQHTFPSVATFPGDICTCRKWFLIRCHEYSKRPPAAAKIHHSTDTHINIVNVRAFFSVDLNAYKYLIHQSCDLRVLKRLVRHYVTPMTCRITNGKKNRFIFLSGFFKSLRFPGIPIYGVLCML